MLTRFAPFHFLTSLWNPIADLVAKAADQQTVSLVNAPSMALSPKRVALQQGEQCSPLTGHGLDLKGYRPYQLGDDSRYIDWTLYARTLEPYVRQYHAETQWPCWLIIDAAPSMYCGQARRKLVCVLMWLMPLITLLTQTHATVSLAIHHGRLLPHTPQPWSFLHVKPHQALPAIWQQLQHLFTQLQQVPIDSQDTTIPMDLSPLIGLAPHRCVSWLFSDLTSPNGRWLEGLHTWASRHHLWVMHTLDPLDTTLPAYPLSVQLRSPGSVLSPIYWGGQAQPDYTYQQQQWQAQLKAQVQSVGAHYKALSTDSPIETVLTTILAPLSHWEPIALCQ